MGNAKMVRILLVAGFICAIPFSPAHPALNHAPFTSLLQAHVKKGLVDYRSLKNDTRMDLYISALSGTDPDTLPKNEQIAFWINVYNALTLRLIRDNYPVQSINKLHPGGTLLSVLRPYLPEAAAGLVAAEDKNIRIKYLPYDWSLNGKKYR